MQCSARMQAVQLPIIPLITEWIRETPNTISLGQGVVSYPPPPEATEQMHSFLRETANHKYQPGQGIPELVALVEAKLKSENQIDAPCASEVFITAGANMAFTYAVLAVTDPGDEVILQLPYYFNHEMAVAMAGCKPVCVPTDGDYQLEPQRIRRAINKRTRAVVTISPNNPTGAVYPASVLSEVNAICAQHGLYHISDEAYENFTFDGVQHFSPGSISAAGDHTISLFSLSKAYGFAGWRIGYMAVPRHLIMSIRKIQDTILICPPVASQWAAVGALKVGSQYCRQRIQAIDEARHLMWRRLRCAGDVLRGPKSSGAFYFFMRVVAELDSVALAEDLIRRCRVAVVPGATFGVREGCSLRISYGALDGATAIEGTDRLVAGLRDLIRANSRSASP